ncbi:MAG TPA: glycosyltransferase [Candidatus Obscuribacterales bacterium]
MPRGVIPEEYLSNPKIDKAIEEIYADLDAYVHEYFDDEPQHYKDIDLIVVLPPLNYEGTITKGILLSQGADVLVERYPELCSLFFVLAFSMSASYPTSCRADGYLVQYSNPHREAWFREKHRDKRHKLLVPFGDSHYVHEYRYGYQIAPKDIDVLVVSSLIPRKNIPIIAEAIKIYRKKYSSPIRLTLIVGKEFDLNWNGLNDCEREEIKKLENLLVHMWDYIDIVPTVTWSAMRTYYSRARVCVLGSLIGDSNRSIKEAMCADTPVICFKQFNQYARGEELPFPSGAGELSDFDAEALADTIHHVLHNRQDFKPRRSYLSNWGRKNFLNRCVDAIPYFKSALPEYEENASVKNLWIDLAVQNNYDLSLNDFVYGANPLISFRRGLDDIDSMLGFYFDRFALRRRR